MKNTQIELLNITKSQQPYKSVYKFINLKIQI